MTSLRLSVERFDHGESVCGVDPEQLQQHEAERSALGFGAGLDLLPQVGIDRADTEFGHGSTETVSRNRPTGAALVIDCGPTDHHVITIGSSRGPLLITKRGA